MVEILAQSLESESSLHRRVDLFFLVDSITQCSRGQKGICLAGTVNHGILDFLTTINSVFFFELFGIGYMDPTQQFQYSLGIVIN